jgi:2-amino-4-hydroxy-6-hydroxymethyldihydropteridine diphosphokinase
MAVAFVGLGANLGDARATLQQALEDIGRLPGVQSLRASSVYRTAPVDASGPDYLNAVAQLQTTLEPHALLAALQAVENGHGRLRPYRHAPRTLDLDLLLYDDRTIATAELVVPHPRLHERAFVLVPLSELGPGLVVPGRGDVGQLLRGVAGQRIDRLAP